MSAQTFRPLHIVHTEASCGWGGQEIRILEEARGMIARGHRVTLLCPEEARIFAEAPRYAVPVEALPIGRKRLPGLGALRRWLTEHRPDIVNTHSSTDSWLTGLACLGRTDAPAVVRTRHISAPITPNFGARWLYGRSAQHVVTTGEALRQTLIDGLGLQPERVTSIPTGIDTERFSPGDKTAARQQLGLDPKRNYIGIVATLRSWKGHAYLLEAFARLDLSGWILLIIGEGPQMDNLRAQIAQLGLHEHVQLVGQKQDPERWMRALDVFCLPSYANEGVPQSVMQAMLSGLPIVTTPVGAILEAVQNEESALVVAPKDSAALAAAIRRLIDDPALATRLAAKARTVAEARFSREHMLDEMETIFRTVTS